MKLQLKSPFNGIHKSYDKYDSSTFNHKELLVDKLLYLGCVVLELSKLPIYETYFRKIATIFSRKRSDYIDTDAFVISINTSNIFKDLYNLRDLFDFSNLIRSHEIFSKENGKVGSKFKIETHKNNRIDEYICLGSKA